METCYYCGTPVLPARLERDHFPLPVSCGGAITVPACQSCHDLKDRIDWRDIPFELKGEFMEELASMGRIGRILLAKMLAAWYHVDRMGAIAPRTPAQDFSTSALLWELDRAVAAAA